MCVYVAMHHNLHFYFLVFFNFFIKTKKKFKKNKVWLRLNIWGARLILSFCVSNYYVDFGGGIIFSLKNHNICVCVCAPSEN